MPSHHPLIIAFFLLISVILSPFLGQGTVQDDLSKFTFIKKQHLITKGITVDSHSFGPSFTVDFSQTQNFKLHLNNSLLLTLTRLNSKDKDGRVRVKVDLYDDHHNIIKESVIPDSGFGMERFSDGTWQQLYGLGYSTSSAQLQVRLASIAIPLPPGFVGEYRFDDSSKLYKDRYSVDVNFLDNLLSSKKIIGMYGFTTFALHGVNDKNQSYSQNFTILAKTSPRLKEDKFENWQTFTTHNHLISLRYPPDYGIRNNIDKPVWQPDELILTALDEDPRLKYGRARDLTISVNSSYLSPNCTTYDACLRQFKQRSDEHFTYIQTTVAGADAFGTRELSGKDFDTHQIEYNLTFKKGNNIWHILERIGPYLPSEEKRLEQEFFDILSTIKIN